MTTSKVGLLVLTGLLYTVAAFAQTTPIQKAQAAYFKAEALEKTLRQQPADDQTRAEYLKVISAYQRVYLITPQTPYADNALIAVAQLYEQIQETASAIKTLNFLVKEYPKSPLKTEAQKSLVRLQTSDVDLAVDTDRQRSNSTRPIEKVADKIGDKKSSTPGVPVVENLRYWESQNSVRVVIDVTGEIRFKQGEAKGPSRVFIDVSPARLSNELVGKQWPVKSGMLQQIRVGQNENTTVRIVLDVGAIARVASFTLRDPNRLIIDILGQDRYVSPPIAATPIPADAAAAPAIASSRPVQNPAARFPKGSVSSVYRVHVRLTSVHTSSGENSKTYSDLFFFLGFSGLNSAQCFRV